ncbi:MAG TPA: sensor histidine kinase [Clostridia bacterium]|nr:sensor histidine kinase [Clostridia bacterium]
MHFFRNISFWKKLLLMGAIPLALLGVVIGFLSYQKADKVVRQSEKRVLSDTINRVDVSLNVKVRQIDSLMQTVAGSAEAQELARADSAGGKGLIGTTALSVLCQNLFGPFGEISDVNILLGEQLVYTSRTEQVAIDPVMLAELYDRAARYPGKAIWSDLTTGLYERESKSADGLLIYAGLRDTQGETIGLVVAEVNPRTFGSYILTKQKILGYQTTFLTDRAGAIICGDNAVRDDWRKAILLRYKAGERKSDIELGGTMYYVCSQYNGLTGWVTFTMIPDNRLFPEANSLKQYTIVLVAVSIVLAALFLLILALAITKPLARLKTGMKQVQDKNFELQLENDRRDEIGELTETFNYMVNRIHILVNQVYQEKIAQKTAEIEALQAQINPHFLYNTLDTINWMLIDRDEMEVSAIVVALGKLMQYSMDTATSMVSLLEECRHVKDYLLIQKFRLEDRLEFTLNLDPTLETFKVPKLILQPLIENAIDHGIHHSGRPGILRVNAVRAGSRVYITVSDNGRGMTPDELYQFKRLLSNDSIGYKNIGVRNVARRLQLHFNDRCEFAVDNTLGGGLSITIVLPIDDAQALPEGIPVTPSTGEDEA